MTWETWVAFCVLEIVLCFTPGPAVLFVASTALARGPRVGLSGALGIVAGNTFYFALSAIGVAAIILASSYVFIVIKWIGAAYLVLLGVRMLAARRELPRPVDAVDAQRSFNRSLVRGFAVQVANPKALAFFAALLPQFIDPAAAVGYQVLILGATSAVIEFGVLSCYVWLAAHARRFAGDRWTDVAKRVAGGFLIAAGARLALVAK